EGRCARAGVLSQRRATGRPVRHRTGDRPLDGERHVRRRRPSNRVHRIAQGIAHSVFPRSRGGPAYGSLEGSIMKFAILAVLAVLSIALAQENPPPPI